MKTKARQEAPEDKVKAVQTFLQEIRRKSQSHINSQLTQFLPQYFYNMDHTPLPFEFLQNRTSDIKVPKQFLFGQSTLPGLNNKLLLCVFLVLMGSFDVSLFHTSSKSTVEQQPRTDNVSNITLKLLFISTPHWQPIVMKNLLCSGFSMIFLVVKKL